MRIFYAIVGLIVGICFLAFGVKEGCIWKIGVAMVLIMTSAGTLTSLTDEKPKINPNDKDL